MTNDNFTQRREEWTHKRFEMCDEKSKSYTKGSGDRLNNFKELGAMLGVEPPVVMSVYFGKHVLALFHWFKTGQESSEGIPSTIDDLQNYLDLARALYEESQEKAQVYGERRARVLKTVRQPPFHAEENELD